MRIGGSISYQLTDIFNIIEDQTLSEEEKRRKVEEYQASLTDEKNGLLVDKSRRTGQNLKNGFYVFGNIDDMSYEAIIEVKKYVDEVLSSLTCEGEMKMSSLIKGYDRNTQELVYDFSLADKTYTYAMEHGKDMRGHTLVWHKHEPKKVLDAYIEDRLGCTLDEYKEKNPEEFFGKRKELTKDFLASYMKQLGEQYPGCYCWDVLNEIVPELETGRPTKEERDEGLRHSLWREYLGEDFYIDVLETARDNLPEGTELFYNEFGEQHPEKRQAILDVIRNIKKYEEKTGKVILDGIGLQSHYDLNVTPEQIEQIHREFAETGKKVQITEIDIMPGRDRNGNVREFDNEVYENLWKKVFECTEEYGIDAFTGWGLGDDLSWFSAEGIMPTMIDKLGKVKEFAKVFLEKMRGQTKDTISMKNVVENAIKDGVTLEQVEDLSRSENTQGKNREGEARSD